MSAIIRIEGADELIKRLDSIEKMLRVKAAIKSAAVEMRGRIARAPAVSRRKNWLLYGNSARAARMRRGYFYHLNRGDIEVPYRRGFSPGSHKLSQSWAVNMRSDGWVAEIGTNVPYAHLVQDRDEQTSYHAQTGWITVQGAVNVFGPGIMRDIEHAFKREVEG